MLYTVRISSKRQITIPSIIFKQLELQEGDSLQVEVDNKKIILSKAMILLNELAGSIKPPEKYKGKSIDTIIKEAKRDYFAKKE
jgi:AbrB family looped-hinge helix DNA binding protein